MHISNFWKFLDLSLINCEIELVVSCSMDCVLIQHHNNITGATFQINNNKLYITVVNLSMNDNIKFLENIKQGFKRTISWNKYRPERTTQTKNNNLDYLTDPTFRNINRLFALSFENSNNNDTRDCFNKYYMPLVEIKDFNALIDNKPFFNQPVKNKQEAYEKLIEMLRNDNYTTGKLLDYLYHQTHWYRFIKTSKYKYSSRN